MVKAIEPIAIDHPGLAVAGRAVMARRKAVKDIQKDEKENLQIVHVILDELAGEVDKYEVDGIVINRTIARGAATMSKFKELLMERLSVSVPRLGVIIEQCEEESRGESRITVRIDLVR